MPANPQLREQRAGVDEAMPRSLIQRYFQSLYGMALYGMAVADRTNKVCGRGGRGAFITPLS
jgi:hypothetical protein